MADLDEGFDGTVGQPYDGNGSKLVVTKTIHFPQLAEEIAKVLPEDSSFVAEGDVVGPGEVIFHFSSPDVDLAKVSNVIEEHEVNYDHGLSEDQVALNDLKSRLAKGDLAVKDLNALLRLYFAPGLQEDL